MSAKIEDYGFIANHLTGALVSSAGSIDWLCAPRFDSDACLAALLGYDEHGQWSLRPTVALRETRRRYRPDTLILETDFVCESGQVRITDFMPVGGGESCDLIRILEGVEGSIPIEMLLNIRFGYGADRPWVTPERGGLRFTAGPDSMVLRAPLDFSTDQNRVSACFTVKKGDRIPFQLGWLASHDETPEALNADRALAQTESYWREWSGRCSYKGAFRDAVMRSLITLKGLTYEPTGAIVAALTLGLPEAIGGVRNWDYRFCWLRDASLTLDALMMGGYLDEARAFRDWLLRATAGDPDDIQIMYSIDGARRLTEFELDWLPGYEGSSPVRAGNAASGQFQLDVYGEVLSSLYAGRTLGLPPREDAWRPFKTLIEHIEQAWQRPDDGIWEVRGGRRHFTHSKIMAWVAVDRTVKAIEHLGMGDTDGKKLLPHLSALRERIHAEVCQRGWNPRVNSFTQSYGSDVLDASLLVMTHFGFLPASDPRVKGTVAAIEKDLLRDGFVLRYDTAQTGDGLPGTEGAFLACSFWLADNYALAGRLTEAEALFNRLLALRNDLGLLAEEYDPRLRRQVGNFPQAFSHLALITTAHIIDQVKQGKTPGLRGLDLAQKSNPKASTR
jgi:GH15 family glucan-1,4-alpha-glucosidase